MNNLDKALEDAIDSVGRERVFALAEARGWVTNLAPPKWVWWSLVDEVQKQPPHDQLKCNPLTT